jgi:hypothetical protein
MTDRDTGLLRRALRASPEPEPTFDAAAIVTRGRRLRWRRRAVAAGGGVCLAAAVFGAVAGVGRLTAPPSVPVHHTVTPIGPAGPRPRPVPTPRRDAATPSASASPTAIATTRPTAPSATPSGGSRAAATPSSTLSSTPTEQQTENPSPSPTAAG